MKGFTLRFAFLLLVGIGMAFATASAYGANFPSGHHDRTQTYHDRTPKIHTHDSHPHR